MKSGKSGVLLFSKIRGQKIGKEKSERLCKCVREWVRGWVGYKTSY